jgi:formylmethanofuran dehydrogenase subunit B
MDATAPSARDWIDPFCPLLTDRTRIVPGDPPRPLPESRGAATALAHFTGEGVPSVPVASVGGVDAGLEDALAAAGDLIGSWRQPLFCGLGTDVAGARALTRLALRCGAIMDHAHGEAMTQALRALQDRGGFTCTLSEVRNRADLIVCVGIDPTELVADFFQRCGIGESVPGAPAVRQVVFLKARDATAYLDGRGVGSGATSAECRVLDLKDSDLEQVLAELNAACSGRTLPRAGADWAAVKSLAGLLQAASYAVLVYAPAHFPGPHAALLLEALGRIVKTLNKAGRAGALALSGADGAATVSQTATWMTGLPLRTALHAGGFDHDPHRFSSARLLAGGAVDGVLFVSSFSPTLALPDLPSAPPPLIVLGHPAMASCLRQRAGTQPHVFIAVSTPGVNAPGHLFRSDGGVVLALKPFASSSLPSVAEVAGRLLGLMETAS